jgi:uncharacterized protein (TIGR03086 family)
MASQDRGLELLESAVTYALSSAALVTPQLLPCSTPCRGWDLARLLDHLSDSIEVLHEVLATGGIGASAALAHPRPGSDPVARLHGQAAHFLAACTAARPAGNRVTIGDRALSANRVILTGSIEITVHGWDIAAARGACHPIPPDLAIVLLPIAPLFITPAIRPGLFADPVLLAGPACPGDQLVAFLGRQPRLGQGRPAGWPKSAETDRSRRDDS